MLKKEKKKSNKLMLTSLILLFVGYAILILCSFLTNVQFVRENQKIIIGIGSSFIVSEIILNFVCKKIHITKRLAWFVLGAIFATASYFVTHDPNILMFFVMAIGVLTIPFDTFFKIDFFIRLALVALVITLHLTGLVSAANEIRQDSIRYSLGFQHPNTLGMQIMVLALEFSYIFKRFRWGCIAVTLLSIIFLVTVPNSRAAAIILAVLLMYILFKKTTKKILRYRIVRMIIILSFPILTLVSLFSTLIDDINPELDYGLNKITSGRIALYNQAFEEAGVSLLGNPYENRLSDTLDNAYLRLLITYGVIQYLVFLYLSVKSIKQLYDEDQDELVFILFLLQMYGIMESSLLYIQRDSFLIIYSEPVRGSLLKKRKNDE